jgi:trk system potassium uptake protein TrkA
MYIMVIGGGQLGYYLTKGLLGEGHEVLLIEKDAKICEKISHEMGSVCLRGDGCETATLERTGTARADLFIAVTGDDEDNLIACQVAKHRFKAPHTIARVRNPRNEDLFKKLGIDVTISSTRIILEHIEREVPSHRLSHLLTIQDRGLDILEIKVPENSDAVGKTVNQLSLPNDCVLSLVIRPGKKPLVPDATTTIEAQDQIIAIAPADCEEAIRTTLASG